MVIGTIRRGGGRFSVTTPAWEAWFGKLGDALVDKGNPVLGDRSVAGEAGTVLPLGGYTIVNAADLEEATRLASGCPILPEGGAVEVGMLTPVPGRQHPPAHSDTGHWHLEGAVRSGSGSLA